MTRERSWQRRGPTSPVAELRLVAAPDRSWRVERAEAQLAFSQISVIDAAASSGNRFDVPGAGVLYTATSPAGAFAETLSRFRPSASLIEKMHAVGVVENFPSPGYVEPSWFALRRLRAVRLVDPLPFVDVDDPHTHTFLTQHAARDLLGTGVGNLDVAVVRGAERRITRAIAAWLYAQTDATGAPQFSGIRYISRLGPYECWAIFDGTAVEVAAEERVESHPELDDVMEAFGLTR